MQALVESDIRESFGNASDAELAQLSLPHDFLLTEWAHLDAFAWRDPRIAARGYLVTELDGAPVGVVLRAASSNGSHHRAAICNLCHTQQPADQVDHVLRAAGRRGRGSAATASAPTCAATSRARRPSGSGVRRRRRRCCRACTSSSASRAWRAARGRSSPTCSARPEAAPG